MGGLRLGSGLGLSLGWARLGRSVASDEDPTERKEGGGERGLPPARVTGVEADDAVALRCGVPASPRKRRVQLRARLGAGILLVVASCPGAARRGGARSSEGRWRWRDESAVEGL